MRVISFHTRHDANLAVAEGGRLKFVVELERIFRERHFACSPDPGRFKEQWTKVREHLSSNLTEEPFDLAITSWVFPSYRQVLRQVFHASSWVAVDHHHAHAALGFYGSSFRSALILSYDGGGNDGFFNSFKGSGAGIEHLERRPLNLGMAYRALATAMPEVTGRRHQPHGGALTLAGKVMAYAALGEVRTEWLAALHGYYTDFAYPDQALFTLGEKIGISLERDFLPEAAARDLAATSQQAFTEILNEEVARGLQHTGDVDGIVLTGGGALNVVANQCVWEAAGMPVYIPSAPGDGGIAAGAIWATEPPAQREPMTYLGLEMEDDIGWQHEEHRRGARSTTTQDLAQELASGKIIGVVRDRSEVGPRALGNRSILCCARDARVKERLNDRIKFREWYRPFAPVVPAESLSSIFEKACPSPFMSFAPRLRSEVAARLPAISHLDGTARVQSVTPEQNPWLHELLLEVGRLTGDPVLLNTSLNTHGQPIVQHMSAALEVLDSTDLDALLVEDVLIKREGPHE